MSSSTRFLIVAVIAPRVYRSGVTQRRSFDLTGMNLALRRNVMMQPRYESYNTKKLFKAADKLWQASVKATNFGGGDTEEKFVTEDVLDWFQLTACLLAYPQFSPFHFHL